MIDRAIDSANINWKEHALILAIYYQSNGYTNSEIQKLLRKEGFYVTGEIDYAINSLNKNLNSKVLNPSDYVKPTNEQRKLKLKTELGMTDSQINQALLFIETVQNID